MIIASTKIVKIVFALAFMAAGVLRLKGKWDKQPGSKKKGKKKAGQKTERPAAIRLCVLWIVLVGAFAAAANAVAGCIPPLKDVIVLTALGEKNEAAAAEEVFFSGFTVDGEKIPVDAPEEGKWFWYGWRGKVEIRTEQGTQVIDTYAEQAGTVSAEIGRSETSALIWNQIRYLAVYAVALLGLCGLAHLYARGQFKMRPLTALRIGIVLAAFVVMWNYAGVLSLWVDDLATIQFVSEQNSLRENIRQIALESANNPPLFYVFAYFWLRIAPFGTAWLKFPSIVFSCLGIWFCGVAADRIRGERAAVMATLLAATSYFLVNYAAFTFRSYGLLVMLCSLLVIAYHNRLMYPEKASTHVWYGVTLALLLYTNYISVLIFAAMGLCDFCLFLKKKIKLNCILSYIGAGASFLPMLLAKLTDIVRGHENFWPSEPDLPMLFSTFKQVFSDQLFLIIMFFAVAGTTLFAFVWSKAGNERDQKTLCTDMCSILSFWVIFVFGVDYVYSRYINPAGSIFVGRYFTCVLAPALIVTAIGADEMINAIANGREEAEIRIVAVFASLCCLIPTGLRQSDALKSFPGTVNEPYEQATNWIYKHINNLWPDSLVVMTGYRGGLYYYATQGGRRDDLNFGSLTASNWEAYDTVFTMPLHGALSAETVQMLNEHYTMVEENQSLKVTMYIKNAE